MYNFSQYISDIGIFLLPVIGIGISPKNATSVGPFSKVGVYCFTLFYIVVKTFQVQTHQAPDLNHLVTG